MQPKFSLNNAKFSLECLNKKVCFAISFQPKWLIRKEQISSKVRRRLFDYYLNIKNYEVLYLKDGAYAWGKLEFKLKS